MGINIMSAINMLGSFKNPQALYDNMYKSNPKFKEFVDKNQGKTAEQIAMDYKIDLSALRKIFG